MTTQIRNGRVEEVNVVIKKADAPIASFAQKASQLSGLMAVIYIEVRSSLARFISEADRALAALRVIHRVVIGRSDTTLSGEVAPAINFRIPAVVFLNSQLNPGRVATVPLTAALGHIGASRWTSFTAPLLRTTGRSRDKGITTWALSTEHSQSI